MKNLWFCLSFLFICSVALAGQKIIGALEVTGNATIDGGIYGDGSHLSGLFNGVNWPDIGGSQASVNVSGFTNDAGYLNSINWTAFPNSQGYITGVNWDQIAGLQSSVGNSGFTNDANYITQAEINWDALTK